jgi:hypothetical protein
MRFSDLLNQVIGLLVRERRITYWALKQELGVDEAFLEGLCSSRLPLEEAVPLLAALLSVPVPDGRYAPLCLTPQQHKQQTLDTLVAWLLEEAERQPLLAVWKTCTGLTPRRWSCWAW